MSDPEQLYKDFMESVGIKAEGDAEQTPRRVAAFFKEWTTGNRLPCPHFMTRFPAGNYTSDVACRGIKFFSICSHHHVPFFGEVDVVYTPDGYLVGLSKVPRAIRWLSQRPCLQEGLTVSICSYLYNAIVPKSISVEVRAVHMCEAMRVFGAETTETTTSHTMTKGDRR